MHVEVHKFGGTSLSTPEEIRWAAERVQAISAGGIPVVVVVSAVAGVTDALFALVQEVRDGDLGEALTSFFELEEQHANLLGELVSGESFERHRMSLARVFATDRVLLESAGRLGELSAFAENALVTLGERASAILVSATIAELGTESLVLDAHKFLVTDDGPFDAHPIQSELREGARALLVPQLEAGRLPVVTGFAGRNRRGQATTLGRSGSDLTATTLGAALDANRVVVWTDVDGIHSADPDVVQEARTLARMHYAEARTLTHLGARVVHERATEPAANQGVPIVVLKSGGDGVGGTEISDKVAESRPTVRAIGVLENRAWVVAHEGGANAFATLAEALPKYAITLVSQASGATPLSLVLPRHELPVAVGLVPDLEVHDDVAQVALVGHRLAEAGDVLGRASGALEQARIPRLALSMADAGNVASVLVHSRDAEGAARALHEEFRLERGPVEEEAALGVELYVLGKGREARAWLETLEASEPRLVSRFGLGPRLAIVADGTSATVVPSGIVGDLAQEVALALESGAPLPHGTKHVDDFAPEAVVTARMEDLPRRPVLVDLLPGDEGRAARNAALGLGADVVVAHPRALGSCDEFRETLELARKSDRQVFFEAALVPGLPVREAFDRLDLRGDEIAFVEASLSGAVTGALSRVEEGASFSSAWFEVLENGGFAGNVAAELSGRAVVERALALGVAAGLYTSEVEINCRGFIDESAEEFGPEELKEVLLSTVDASVRDRVEGSLDFGERLRFVARLEPGKLEVAPLEVPRETPIGSLHGTDNVVALYSRDASREPLVLRGPGARPRVFHASVVGDLVRAFERR